MSRGSCYSDEESVWSFNNNCSSGTSDRNWSVEDKNWSANESVTKPLLSDKPGASSKKSSKHDRPTAARSDKPKPRKRKGKKQLHKLKGFVAFVRRIVKSEPSQNRLWKAVLGFPVGLVIAAGLFFTVVQPLELDPDMRNLVGSLMGVGMALGFAFSVQVGARSAIGMN